MNVFNLFRKKKSLELEPISSKQTFKISSIQTIKISPDELVFIQLPDNIPRHVLEAWRKHLNKLLGTDKSARVVLHTNEIKLTKIKIDELEKALKEAKEIK